MLKKIIRLFKYFSIKRSVKNNPYQAIVMIDGGICSQIHQWRIGEALRAKGIDVEYDISWFDDYGKDINGKFVRNFDLLKTFPKIPFKRASDAKIWYFKKHFSYCEQVDGVFVSSKLPKYFGYYYPSYYQDLLPFKYIVPVSVLDERNAKLARQIKKEQHAIGVHVRRGDMAITQHNWVVCPPEYFINAVNYFIKKYKNASFYFFSDEPDWVQDNVLVHLNNIKNKVYLVSHNGSDKGYMDLALMSYCEHFVASQGSMGQYANMLNHNKNKILIVPKQPGASDIKVWHNLSDVIARPSLIQ